jgi:protein-L-isoaspartate(D-aspartate) O-methyltransferase
LVLLLLGCWPGAPSDQDTGSILALQLTRPMDATHALAFRAEWSRSETGFRNDFHQRFGASVRVTFRGLGGIRGSVAMRGSLKVLKVLTMAMVALCAGCPQSEGTGWGPGMAGADGQVPGDSALAILRHEMVRRQIAARGVRDTAVLRVMREVPRHLFVPEARPNLAYGDHPLPISHGQTISQPYIVAFMAEAAEIGPADRVLEIGTGSGYGAAVLAELASEVYTIEIVTELAERARLVLERTGYDNVQVLAGNGWLGWPEHAPFDAIVVTAAPREVPPALVEQLAVGGVMVVPVGDVFQDLRIIRKTARGVVEESSIPVRFVPMVGRPRDTLP